MKNSCHFVASISFNYIIITVTRLVRVVNFKNSGNSLKFCPFKIWMEMKIDRVVMYRTYFRYSYIGTILLSNPLSEMFNVQHFNILNIMEFINVR